MFLIIIYIGLKMYKCYREYAMPKSDLPLEVQYTDHDLAFCVITCDSQGTTVTKHGATCVCHAHH